MATKPRPQIVLFTFAYNAEKHLHMSVDSILNQTYRDFVYYILDNGSTDSTHAIIQEYAQKDERVRTITRDVNHTLEPDCEAPIFTFVEEHARDAGDNAYFAELDADDEYDPDFLKKTIRLAEKHNLDIAACGTQFIAAQTGQPMDTTYSIPYDMILNNEEYAKYFTAYLQFMWTIWGKLYRFSLLKQCEFENARKAHHSADTMFATEAFRRAKRVGILGGTLHKYYISQKSVSNKFDNKRISSDPTVFGEYLAFLDAHNAATKKNIDYIYSVHINSVRNTIIVVLRSQIEPLRKLEAIRDALTHEYAQTAIHGDYAAEDYKAQMQEIITDGVLELAKTGDDAELDIAAEILIAIPRRNDCVAYARQNNWNDHDILPLLIKMSDKLEGNEGQSDIIGLIMNLMLKYPLLEGLSLGLASSFSKTISLIMKETYADALGSFLATSEDVEIDDDDVDAYFLLGQHLSAAAEDMGVYVYFKKLWIAYLLDHGRTDEAKSELDDFLELFPEDEDFISLKSRLEENIRTENE